jgi:hypothetical protein
MLPLQIKRQRYSSIHDKQLLRTHIDGLPLDKQREFVATALQLIAERTNMSDAEVKASFRLTRQDVKQ